MTIRIAHISDLHFGSAGQIEVWRSLRDHINDRIRPHVIVITGDIVHTTKKNLYKEARDELQNLHCHDRTQRYRVCPGNHDRHPLGNAPGPFRRLWYATVGVDRAPAWFDNAFGGFIPTVEAPLDCTISDGGQTWKIRLIGLDTSAEAQYTAQGFAPPRAVAGLAAAAKGDQDADLVILLHHHHLLSIGELEESQQRFGNIFRPTVMLNSGTVLEALARGHINIVLHGHEHCRFFARYGTLYGQQNDTVVIGAGSATGNDSREGCDFRRASFNLIELRRDRSVYIQEVRHNGIKWDDPIDPTIRLLDGRAIRRARFYRRTDPASTPTSKILKSVEFHSDRSIDVTQTWTDWVVENGRWVNTTINNSGMPSTAYVKFDWRHDGPEEHDGLHFSLDADHTYRIEVQTRRRAEQALARQIVTRFQWLGGAVLTEQDIHYLDPTNLGEFRRRMREFVVIRAHNEVQEASLLVRVPPIFAPAPQDVSVLYGHPNATEAEFEAIEELNKAVQHHATGVFSLQVHYPRPKYRYVLTWPVRRGSAGPSAAAGAFHAKARSDAGRMLRTFAGAAGRLPVLASASFGLYLPNGEAATLTKVAEHRTGRAANPSCDIPGQLSLRDNNTVHRQAWWGKIQRGIPDEHNGERLRPGERALAIVPIRHPMHRDDLSWGLVRVGVHADPGLGEDALISELAQPQIEAALADGVLLMLEKAVQTG